MRADKVRVPCSALVGAFAVVGCIPDAHWYGPVTAQKARGPVTELETKSITRNGSHTVVTATARPITGDVAFGRPRLTTPDAPPCATGENANLWSEFLTDEPAPHEPAMHGMLTAKFWNAHTDPRGLLLNRPTVLDVPVMTPTGSSQPAGSCLRLPLLVSGDGAPEWRQAPRWWLGLGLRVEVPLHRLNGAVATVVVPLAFGAFAGPVRVGIELGTGPAYAPNDGGVFAAGARVDSPLLVVQRFATGLKLAYEVAAWGVGLDPNTNAVSWATVHGPRAALRFLLLPPPSPSTKFDARPDSWSTGLEFSASLLYVAGDGGPTPALGGSYFGDIGF
jgi:hypothetical protein